MPIRMTICDSGPAAPDVSARRAVSVVSPGGKTLSALITKQNCTTPGTDDIKLGEPKASTVHARAGFVFASKAQLKSFNAFEMVWIGLKSGGSTPGTPPAVHTPGRPFPSAREASI